MDDRALKVLKETHLNEEILRQLGDLLIEGVITIKATDPVFVKEWLNDKKTAFKLKVSQRVVIECSQRRLIDELKEENRRLRIHLAKGLTV